MTERALRPAKFARLAVAVGTEQPEILKPVVVGYAVDVVERERQRPVAPLGEPALFTFVLLQALADQAPFEVEPMGPTALDQKLAERGCRRARDQLAPLNRAVPRSRRESEPQPARSKARSLVVIGLDGGPVVTPAAIAVVAETASVVADRRRVSRQPSAQ